MDVHLDLNMTMIRPLDGLRQVEYLKEFGDIYNRLKKRLEPVPVNQEQWKRDMTYLWHEDQIVVPSDRIPALLKCICESNGHVWANRTLKLFEQWFHSMWTDDQLLKTLQPIVDKCPCRSCKPGDIRDRGLYLTLPIPDCANSVLYVDYAEMPKFGGYDLALVVTCGLSRFTRVFLLTRSRGGAWPRDAAVDTHKQAGRQGTVLTSASSCSGHVTKRFRILATLRQGNESMYSNTSGYVQMG